MADFDPDAYLAEKTGQTTGAFDPDKYLAEKTGTQPAAAAAPADPPEKLNAVDSWAQRTGIAEPLAKASDAALKWGVFTIPTLYDKLTGTPDDPSERRQKAVAALQGATLGRGGQALGYPQEYHDAAAAHRGYELAGALAAPIPGGGGASIPARLASNAAIGAGVGAASGDTGLPLWQRTLVGAGAGLAGGLAGEGVNAVGRFAARKSGQAVGDAANQASRQVADDIASKQGAYRSAVQSASRDLEVLERMVDAGEPYASKAKAILDSPQGQQLRMTVLEGKVATAPERLAEVAGKRAEWQAAQQGAQGATEAATEEALASPFSKQVVPRVLRMAQHQVPPLVGGALGGVPGSLVGAAVSGVMGNPGRTVANMMRSPATRKALWDTVQAVARQAPERLGPYGALLAREVESGRPEAALALHTALAEKDPDYQQHLTALAQQKP